MEEMTVQNVRTYPSYLFTLLQWCISLFLLLVFIFIIGLVDGMEACLNLNFRPNATKIVCIITDAPPHALDPKSDDFPDGMLRSTSHFTIDVFSLFLFIIYYLNNDG